MKSIEVAGEVLQLSTETSGSDRGAIIDSGTTLAYLPDDVYDKIVDTVCALSWYYPSSRNLDLICESWICSYFCTSLYSIQISRFSPSSRIYSYILSRINSNALNSLESKSHFHWTWTLYKLLWFDSRETNCLIFVPESMIHSHLLPSILQILSTWKYILMNIYLR